MVLLSARLQPSYEAGVPDRDGEDGGHPGN